MTIIKVRAAVGVRVPFEGAPRTYITVDSGEVVVERSHYYLKQIDDGDLILCDSSPEVVADDSPASPAKSKK